MQGLTQTWNPSRREFLKAGGITALGLMESGALATSVSRLANPTDRLVPRAQNVIFIFLGGGLSQLESFDPKPAAPLEMRGLFPAIATSVPGLFVSDRLPRTSLLMDQLALIRSGTHGCDQHETAANYVLSGRLGSPFGDYPAIGAVVTHQLKPLSTLPPYVAIPANPYGQWELGKSGFLGSAYESYRAGNPHHDGYPKCNHLSLEAAKHFAVDREPVRLRDRYGRHTFGQSCLLARRLIEQGVHFVTVSCGGWDLHANLWPAMEQRLTEFDQGFSTLLTDLGTRGLLEQTLVVVSSEFGRSPKINSKGGRDHWPAAASLLFAGAGVQGGRVIGATDRHGTTVIDRPVTPEDVACTVFESMGIDSRSTLAAPAVQPLNILGSSPESRAPGSGITDGGANIHELFP
jgi:hypothetical protein